MADGITRLDGPGPEFLIGQRFSESEDLPVQVFQLLDQGKVGNGGKIIGRQS